MRTNTPTISTVVGVGPWMDKRARVHQGPLTHPLSRFRLAIRPRIRGGAGRLARVFRDLKFSFFFSFWQASSACSRMPRRLAVGRTVAQSRQASQRWPAGSTPSRSAGCSTWPFDRDSRGAGCDLRQGNGGSGVGRRPARQPRPGPSPIGNRIRGGYAHRASSHKVFSRVPPHLGGRGSCR